MTVSAGYKTAEALQEMIVGYLSSGVYVQADYKRLRRDLLENARTAKHLPQFIRDRRDFAEVMQYLSAEFAVTSARKDFIWQMFRPFLDLLEFEGTPVEQTTSELLQRLGMPGVYEAWNRALSRHTHDPAGAITAARTLLEEACKHILSDLGVAYDGSADLPKLYKMTAGALLIAPTQHTEGVFKQILGGCTAVVEGLGALRNRVGDAHGKGPRPVRPASRHAQLAIDLAGSVATFLFATWQVRKGEGPSSQQRST